MPTYNFKCPDCQSLFERTLSIQNRNEPQACTCGCVANKVVSEGVEGVLRGDGWVGKNLKVREQMAARRAKVGEREAELRRRNPKLVPNVDGEEVSDWNDASKLARDKGKDTKLYNERAIKEKKAR